MRIYLRNTTRNRNTAIRTPAKSPLHKYLRCIVKCTQCSFRCHTKVKYVKRSSTLTTKRTIVVGVVIASVVVRVMVRVTSRAVRAPRGVVVVSLWLRKRYVKINLHGQRQLDFPHVILQRCVYKGNNYLVLNKQTNGTTSMCMGPGDAGTIPLSVVYVSLHTIPESYFRFGQTWFSFEQEGWSRRVGLETEAGADGIEQFKLLKVLWGQLA